MTPAASSGTERFLPSAGGWVSFAKNGIEVIGEYLENLLAWMELTGGARGPVTLGSGLRTGPRLR